MPNRFWSIGPQFAMTLFDAGLRRYKVEQAEARYDQQVARYRQTTLQAIGEVEDALVQLNVLAEEIVVQREALAASQDTLRLTENQYQAGMVDYLAVTSAQTIALNSQRPYEFTRYATDRQCAIDQRIALVGRWKQARSEASLPTLRVDLVNQSIGAEHRLDAGSGFGENDRYFRSKGKSAHNHHRSHQATPGETLIFGLSQNFFGKLQRA